MIAKPRPSYKDLYFAQKKQNKFLLIYCLSVTILGVLILLGANRRLDLQSTEIDGVKRREKGIFGVTMAYADMYEAANANKFRYPTTPTDVIDYVFGKDAPTMLRVAKCESGLNPNAKNKESSATGLFQIMASVHGIDKKWLVDPMINAIVAKKLYDRQGITPWVSSNPCHKLAGN
jgi:hypothetical protein